MTNYQALASGSARPHAGLRLLSERECEAVAGGIAQDPWNEGDEWIGGYCERRWWLLDETGEEITITATIHNDGGGYCPTDSGWIPNFLENLFDGDKYYFSSGPFQYAMKGENGTLCLYDHDSNLVGGYVGVSNTGSYVMSVTFTTNATTGEVAVAVGLPGTNVSGGSGTTAASTAVTIFLGPAGQ